MWLPEPSDVTRIHEHLVALFEAENDPISPSGVKSQALLESACQRPHTGGGDVDKYKTITDKAAALFHFLDKNHAFHNGNKRTAVVTLLTVLHRNDKRLISDVTDDDIYNLALGVAANEYPTPGNTLSADEIVIEIASWIHSKSESVANQYSSMKITDFIRRCESAGATAKTAKSGATVITNGDRNIRISRSTRKIDGPVVKRWLHDLRIDEVQSGVGLNDFLDEAFEARDQILRFQSALKRLAKT